MATKRKWDELEDSDDEEPLLGRQILPVADLPEDFNKEPTDGLEYLFTVRRDARSLPHVTRAPNPYEVPESTHLSYDNRVIPRHITLPSEEWRRIFEIRFKNFRKNVNQPTIHVAFTPQNQHARLIPDKKERDSWWSFLAGKPESEWNPPKQLKQTAAHRQFSALASANPLDTLAERKRQHSWQTNDEGEVESVLRGDDPSDTLPTPTESPTPSGSMEAGPSIIADMPTIHQPREPSPTLLSLIDERTALHLLMYFTHWINIYLQKRDFSLRPLETHARWIFSLLSKVEDYISADDTNLLRNLARACIALLREMLQSQEMPVGSTGSAEPDTNVEFMNVRACWIIISIVAGIWAQHDLWTDAEDMLKSLEPNAGV